MQLVIMHKMYLLLDCILIFKREMFLLNDVFFSVVSFFGLHSNIRALKVSSCGVRTKNFY